MTFTSVSYLIFFPVVALLFFNCPVRHRWWILLAASCLFYMAFIPAYILILFYLIVVDYFAGIWIENAEGESRRNFLILSCFANVSVLAIFKYYDFLAANMALVLSWVGMDYTPGRMSIILPIGLSFHTFQSLSYTFEVYYGRQKAERNIGHYALYVMFFPQLVAGPIERPANLLPQLFHGRPFDYTEAVQGLRLILWGFVQKILIADKLAVFVDEAYADPSRLGGTALLIATVMFAFQILCDFSAYSDIAIGSARFLRITLMKNFDAPYLASSVSEFWRRWHISLSTWFRDYVYIPLGGNRGGRFARYRNVLTVFVLSGLWHGANWTFVIWGLIHGLLVVLEDAGRRFSPGRMVSWPLTFLAVCLAWVFFRARTVGEALLILSRIVTEGFALTWGNLRGALVQLYLAPVEAAAFVFLIVLVTAARGFQAEKQPAAIRWALYYAAVLLVLIFGSLSSQPFIYFQF